jgi:hypothetical protein
LLWQDQLNGHSQLSQDLLVQNVLSRRNLLQAALRGRL